MAAVKKVLQRNKVCTNINLIGDKEGDGEIRLFGIENTKVSSLFLVDIERYRFLL